MALLLHARGNRRDAVGYLREADVLFAGVGAAPDLQRLPMTASCRNPTARRQSPLDFTEREQDVVALARRA